MSSPAPVAPVRTVSQALQADLLERRKTSFVLWQPRITATAPRLILGQFQPGNPPTLAHEQQFSLRLVSGFRDLWEIPAADCHLASGQVYHYWFEVEDTNPDHQPPGKIRCTDPLASTVDWRLLPPRLPAPYTADDQQPAAVAKFENGRLAACDPGGETADFAGDASPALLPANNQMVIYELPTAWSREASPSSLGTGVGTFRDVLAMIDPGAGGANFSDLAILQPGRAYLSELGVNALQLLPPADSFFKREWGYDTAHFLAPDYDLGFPEGNSWPTANSDLANLVRTCHQHGIRFFVDMVMAFARHEAYQNIDLQPFYITDPAKDTSDPDALTSTRGYGVKETRNAFGSILFRYAAFTNTYDPISGQATSIVPARQLMLAQLTRWMQDFCIDGIRMDSVENVANWDFIGDFRNRARQLWQDRWNAQSLGAGADARFLVVGEELSLPMDLLHQQRLDGLWNDSFRSLVRAAILGQNADQEPSFEWTVRKAIDCRNIGFADGAQAVNYITSHDVEGYRRERLFNFLQNNGIQDIEKRVKLAFVCLLTAVGIPMILAGEEFADQHDRFDQNGNVTQSGGKQVDPVNFERAREPMRQRILDYVSALVKLRTTHPALAVNDTEFIHVDFNDGKRVLAWRRGAPGSDPVVVLANFSDFVTTDAGSPSAEYVVHNWPPTPAGRHWREVTQNRDVPPAYVGREPIFPWEAKVYTLA
jgi:pullulanase